MFCNFHVYDNRREPLYQDDTPKDLAGTNTNDAHQTSSREPQTPRVHRGHEDPRPR